VELKIFINYPTLFKMSNEEILEEIYTTVRENNLLEEFSEEVNKTLSKTGQKNIYEVVNEIYYRFISEGILKESN